MNIVFSYILDTTNVATRRTAVTRPRVATLPSQCATRLARGARPARRVRLVRLVHHVRLARLAHPAHLGHLAHPTPHVSEDALLIGMYIFCILFISSFNYKNNI